MSLIRQFAIRNELLYSGFVFPNVQIFFVQKISFATFGVSIDDFFTRYAGLFYFTYLHIFIVALLNVLSMYLSLEIEINHLINALSSKSFHNLLLFPC